MNIGISFFLLAGFEQAGDRNKPVKILSTFGAAALKFVYVVWEGASSGVTIDDDDVAKIEIPEADASSVVLKHTYSSANGKNVWIALEDINELAGRFFVYPKSHKLNIPENNGNKD